MSAPTLRQAREAMAEIEKQCEAKGIDIRQPCFVLIRILIEAMRSKTP